MLEHKIVEHSVRLLCTILAALALSFSASAQGLSIGQEVTVSYSGANAQLAPPNTPATNFNAGATNTFLLSVASTVSVRVYLTNDTANACPGFQVQIFAATDAQTTSFNNALQNWQTVALQTTAGGLSPIIQSLTLPASGAIYITSAAIQAPKVAIQILNTSGNSCSTTTMEATAYISPVSVTSPLISSTGPSVSGSAGLIQGIQPAGFNANAINPVVIGGANLSNNGTFLNNGLDSFIFQSDLVNNPASGIPFVQGLTPAPSQASNELALAFATQAGAPNGNFWNKPWSSSTLLNNSPSQCTNGGAGNTVCVLAYNPAVQNTPLQTLWLGSLSGPFNAWTWMGTFKQGSLRQIACCSGSLSWFNAQLAGSSIFVFAHCAATATIPPCVITSLSSSAGNTYAIVSNAQAPVGSSGNSDEVYVFANTNVIAASNDTITANLSSGTIQTMVAAEISNTTPSSLTLPSIPLQADTTGRIVTAPDAQQPNLWTCTVTLSTNTTTLCQAVGTTIDGIPVRSYVTDYQINTTIAGTATTIQLITGTGTNCGTSTVNLSAIAYPNTAVGIQSVGPFHTAIFTPLQNEVCAKQAGTTAGTSVIEVHGFYAP